MLSLQKNTFPSFHSLTFNSKIHKPRGTYFEVGGVHVKRNGINNFEGRFFLNASNATYDLNTYVLKCTALSQRSFKDLLIIFGYFTFSFSFIVYHLFIKKQHL